LNKNAIWVELLFEAIYESSDFENAVESLQGTISEELEFWTETNSLYRGSLKNLAIVLVIDFFEEGIGIDLELKTLIDLCEWQSMYRN